MKSTTLLLACCILFSFTNCSVNYNMTGAGAIDAKTFQVNYFQNLAPIVEPGIERTFTLRLQDVIQNQTNLNLTSVNGDLLYEGEIVSFGVSPMTATADQRASQNRLTITVNVRFTNKKKEADNFEKRFTFFDDFPADTPLAGAQLSRSLDIIFERITLDIFNESLAKW